MCGFLCSIFAQDELEQIEELYNMVHKELCHSLNINGRKIRRVWFWVCLCKRDEAITNHCIDKVYIWRAHTVLPMAAPTATALPHVNRSCSLLELIQWDGTYTFRKTLCCPLVVLTAEESG